MKKTVVAVYTGQGLAEQIRPIFNELLPDCRLINVIDDGLIHDVIKEGEVSPNIARRLTGYFRQAQDMGADVILNTCSSVGEVVDTVRPLFDVPIVKIDERMAQQAVSQGSKIGVIATLPTTLAPTVRLIKSQAAKAGKEVTVIDGLAEGAYHALIGGKPEEHDRLIEETAARVAQEADVIVLAQGSMMRMQAKLQEKLGKPVLSSPVLGIQEVKEKLGL